MEEVKVKRLSVRQVEALIFIKSFIEKNGYGPSVRELATGLNLRSSSTAHGYFDRLKKYGYIIWDAKSPRTVKVIGDPPVAEEVQKLREEVATLRAENAELKLRLPQEEDANALRWG